MTDCYKVLGIEPTRDIKVIKRAYAKLLPLNNPETDPEGFQVLRAAYEEAIGKINEEDSDNKDISTVDAFMEKFEEFYSDYEKRIDTKAWTSLLDRDVCFQIDTGKEISNRILSFIMDHYYYPAEVWQLFNNYFSWSAKKESLYKQFPKNFIDYVVNKTISKNFFRYGHLLECKNQKQEEFLAEYYKASTALEDYNLYDAEKSMGICRDLCPDHPDLLILASKYMMTKGRCSEAIEGLTSLLEKNSEDVFAYVFRGHHSFRMGKNEEAYQDYKRAIALYPESEEVLFSLGKCCTVLEKYEEAVGYLESLDQIAQNNREVNILLQSARNYQLDRLKKLVEESPEDVELQFKLAKLYYTTRDLEGSYAILSQLEQKNQVTCEIYLMLSNVLLVMGKKELAYTNCCKGISLYPDKHELHAFKALLLDELGNYEESVNTYETAISINPNDPMAYNNKAYSLNRLNRFTEALESADKAIELAPNMANGYKNKADALLGLQLYQECLDACEEALNYNIYLEDVYLIKMKLFTRVRQYEEALIIYSKAEGVGLRSSKLLYEKANTLQQMGRFDEAIDLCDSALEMDPENYEPYYCKGLSHFKKENYSEAIEYLEKAISYHTHLENAYYYKILSLMNSQNTQDALRDLDTVIKMDTANRDSFHDLKGEIYFDANEYEKSMVEYKKAIEKNPENAHYYYCLGKCINRLRHHEDAIQYFDLAIEKDPSRLEAYIDKSHALYNIGKYEACIDQCDIALKADPDYLLAHRNKAWALFALGKAQEAEAVCNEGLKLDGNYVNLLYLKLDILKGKNMLNEALAVIERIIELEPDNKDMQNEREELRKRNKPKSGLINRLFG